MVFDIISLGIILILTIAGIIRGFTKEIINLFGNIAAIFLSFKYYNALFQQLKYVFESFPTGGKIACIVIIYIAVLFVFFVISVLIRGLLKVAHLTFVDRLLGGIFGFIKGVIIVSVIFIITVTFYPKSEKKIKNCITYPLVQGISETIIKLTPKDFRTKFFNRAFFPRGK